MRPLAIPWRADWKEAFWICSLVAGSRMACWTFSKEPRAISLRWFLRFWFS
jgi:hypothetical protein